MKSASSWLSSTLGKRGRSMLSEVRVSETHTRSCERVDADVDVDVDAECCSPGDGIVMSFRSARSPEKRGVWNAWKAGSGCVRIAALSRASASAGRWSSCAWMLVKKI